jgi:hypothetical protein
MNGVVQLRRTDNFTVFKISAFHRDVDDDVLLLGLANGRPSLATASLSSNPIQILKTS